MISLNIWVHEDQEITQQTNLKSTTNIFKYNGKW